MVQLVPHGVGGTTASIWVGVYGSAAPPPGAALSAAGRVWVASQAAWTVVDAGGWLPAARQTVWTQTVDLDGLAPGTTYTVTCEIQGQRAACRVTTPPEALPREPDRPFTILLGSCFAWFQDEEGLAGVSVSRLPGLFRPDLKIFCGDQVYLDNPWYEVLPQDREGLAARLFDKYMKTWTQGDGQGGFSALLANGGAVFLADDHEFWNNHPNWSPLVLFRGSEKRDEWIRIATALFRSFQATPGRRLEAAQRFTVGPVEFYTVDTRFGRQPGDEAFMDPGELRDLLDWLEQGAVDRPGILILGAPIFTQAASWFSSKFVDHSLANYRQFAPLAEAILHSRRSLLVLAGDVHYGRAATARLPSGASLVELISSPLALVDKSVGGDFHEAPPLFPTEAAGLPRVEVETLQWDGWSGPDKGPWEDQFLTLGFTETDQAVRVHATLWQIHRRPPYGPIQRGRREFTLPRRTA